MIEWMNDEYIRSLPRMTFHRGGIDSFVMTTRRSLGDLLYLRIWHDNTGNLSRQECCQNSCLDCICHYIQESETTHPGSSGLSSSGMFRPARSISLLTIAGWPWSTRMGKLTEQFLWWKENFHSGGDFTRPVKTIWNRITSGSPSFLAPRGRGTPGARGSRRPRSCCSSPCSWMQCGSEFSLGPVSQALTCLDWSQYHGRRSPWHSSSTLSPFPSCI